MKIGKNLFLIMCLEFIANLRSQKISFNNLSKKLFKLFFLNINLHPIGLPFRIFKEITGTFDFVKIQMRSKCPYRRSLC